jgi:hypothetical protein
MNPTNGDVLKAIEVLKAAGAETTTSGKVLVITLVVE